MATPGWVRRHRHVQHTLRTIAVLELSQQAQDRVDVEREPTEEWTPRQGMTFAEEQT